MTIITIGGKPGSGKSTVAKLLAKKLNYGHYSSGNFMRDLAEERKISLLELSRIAEKNKSIDQEIDERQIELGRKEDNFVIDARLGFHFIPNSIKIYLDADFEERAKRILADKIRKEQNIDLQSTKENMKTREESEKKRYKGYYDIDPNDQGYYDLIIDTTSLTPEQAVDKILEFIKNK